MLNQVVLSFGIPFVLIPLVWLTSRRNVLGEHPNQTHTVVLGILAAVALVALNVTLLYLTFS